MSELPAYERDPYLHELQVEILEVGASQGRPWARLDDTVLYPEGGGQPADRGFIGDVEVVDVRREGGAIRHVLASPVATGPARLRLDWPRRFEHMQQHTGQHLLTAVALSRFGWPTTAFHLGPVVSDIELGVASLTREQLDALEEAVAGEIRAARRVRCFRVSQEEAARLPVRSRMLPEGLVGDLRLVEIEEVDLNTCGGTHVRSTAELEALKLLDTEPMRGGTRVFFVAGGRLRRRLGAHEARNAELRLLLDSGEADFAPVVGQKLEQLREAERRERSVEEELALAHAESLAGKDAAVLHAHFAGRDAAFLQRVARRFVELAAEKVALLTAGGPGPGFFVVVAGERAHVDLAVAGRAVAEALGGRGGGAGRIFQGKAGDVQHAKGALELLRSAVAGAR